MTVDENSSNQTSDLIDADDPRAGAESPHDHGPRRDERTDTSPSAAVPGEVDGKLTPTAATPSRASLFTAAILMLGVLVILGGVAGWGSYRAHQLHQKTAERTHFLDVARQGALNLTTIDHTRIDADIQRILDSSTGSFHDDFQRRSAPFAEVVRKAQSTSQGTIVDAGIESAGDGSAQILVAVAVKTTNAANQDDGRRQWRMRISVQEADGSAKVSNVDFVP
ncbi:Mce protein [Mycolicibacterium sp. 624]|uniref:Mce protein n=1 Tax=Mycolicibacterium sp. 624 TaxID=3156314 RepID=UPI00339906AF